MESDNDQFEGEGRIFALFNRAMSFPVATRDEFLRLHCADDPEALARLKRMLSAEETGDLSVVAELRDFAESVLEAKPAPIPTVGESLGGYLLAREIGRGGGGVVFEAQQSEPIRRRVAVKVLHAGLNSSEVLARFEAERETLASMDHPNIAKVFDAGMTATGLPYYVMQFVDGTPITTYSDERRLSVDERLGLLATVCEAVEHAHIKGVVHRDLKPANILVSSTESGPLPMVIDFGVAKLLAASERGVTRHETLGRGIVGTWGYMSPEQAEARPGVDTRSDVYSLGVLLYQLLCGSMPFDAATLREAALGEVLRIIREEPPLRPSQRLLRDEQAGTRASARKATVPVLVRRLRGDLGDIPLHAMNKEPERRYQRAIELADDLRNYLNNRPVRARRPSSWYRARKFTRRHRTLLVALTLVVASMIASVVVSVRAARRAGAERDRATTLAGFFADRLLGSAVEHSDAASVTLESLLVNVERGVEEDLLAKRLPARDGQLFLATLAQIYNRMFLRPQAEHAARAAIAIATSADGDPRALRSAKAELVESLFKLGSAESIGEAVMVAGELVTELDREGGDQEEFLTAKNLLAGARKAEGTESALDAAEALYREVLDGRTKLLGPLHLGTLITRHNLIMATTQRGDLAKGAGRADAARQAYESTLPESEQLIRDMTSAIAAEADGPAWERAAVQRRLLIAREEYARQHVRLGTYSPEILPKALALYAEVLPEMEREFSGRGDAYGTARGAYAALLNKLGRKNESAAENARASAIMADASGVGSPKAWELLRRCANLTAEGAAHDPLRERLQAVAVEAAALQPDQLSEAIAWSRLTGEAASSLESALLSHHPLK